MFESGNMQLPRRARTALADLDLEHLWIVCPTAAGHAIDEKISSLALWELADLVERGVLYDHPA